MVFPRAFLNRFQVKRNRNIDILKQFIVKVQLTISVLQACCAVTPEYGIPSHFIRKSTASPQIKISTAQLNFSNRNVMIF